MMRPLLIALLLLPAAASARDVTDYPVCLEIRSEIMQMVPRYYTPKQVVDLVERCMTWEDNMRARGYERLSHAQEPLEGASPHL